MPDIHKVTRGASPILLVLAALCFLLPFVGVSCNTAAAQGALGPAIQSLGGSSGQSDQATKCLQALSNRDLATYSGANLAFGGSPSTPSNLPGCDAGSSTPTSSPDSGNIGVQPLVLMALILIVVGVLATPLRTPLRNLVAGGAALLAAVLVLVNNSTVHTPIFNKLSSSSGSNSLAQFGGGSLETFFSVHASIGFTLVLIALLLALLVNAAGAATAMGLKLSSASPAAPGEPPGGWAPTVPPPGAPPPPEGPSPASPSTLDDPMAGGPSPAPGPPLDPGPPG